MDGADRDLFGRYMGGHNSSCLREQDDETREETSHPQEETTTVHSLFFPIVPDVIPLMESVTRRICKREIGSLQERALSLAMIARFEFKVPKDVGRLLYRTVINAEMSEALDRRSIREFEVADEENTRLCVLFAHHLRSEREKWLHIIDCISSVVFFVDAAFFHTQHVEVCGCCGTDMIVFAKDFIHDFFGSGYFSYMRSGVSALILCLNRDRFVEQLKLGFTPRKCSTTDSVETKLEHVATYLCSPNYKETSEFDSKIDEILLI